MDKEKLVELFETRSPKTEMSQEEMMVMMNLMLTEEPEFKKPIEELDKETEIYKHFKPLLESFQIQVFLKRLEHMTTLKITLGALITLVEHIGRSAGAAVMYAYYLHHKLPENTLVDVNEISMNLFPWGFFSEEQLHEIWEAQKVPPNKRKGACIGAPDNMIDYPEVWK